MSWVLPSSCGEGILSSSAHGVPLSLLPGAPLVIRNRTPLELRCVLTVPLELWWGYWESSQVASEDLGHVSSCDGELGVPLEFQ